MTTSSSPRLPTGMNQSQLQRYKATIGTLESRNNYGIIGGFNDLYSGKYQIGTQALQGQGYVRRGPVDINNPKVWRDDQGNPLRDGIGSRQDFLKNPAVQEKVMDELTRRNSIRLDQLGVTNANTPPDQRAGLLGAAHLIGADGLYKQGLEGTDGWGTKARKYHDQVIADQNGTSTSPTQAATAAAPPVAVATPVPPRPATTITPLPSGGPTTGDFARADRRPTTTEEVAPELAMGAGRRPTTDSSATVNPTANPTLTVGPTVEINVAGGSTSKEQVNIELPIKNILEPYTSMNYLFTFSCLSTDSANFPDKHYRQNKLGKIIAASGGQKKERVSTAYVTQDNPTGEYDFFIDNVSMDSIIAPTVGAKGTNVFGISFEVYEPYSIGQFLQACELASFEQGHRLYGQAPYLLTIDFVGATADNNYQIIQQARRYIPIRIINVDMSVNASGCKYSVNATVWNEIALLDSANVLQQDVTLQGKNPSELLQTGFRSLAGQINARLREKATANKGEVSNSYIPDEIAIIFPIFQPQSQGQAENNQGATSSSSDQKSIGAKVSLERIDGGPGLSFFRQKDATISPLGKAGMSFDLTRGSVPNKEQEIKVWDARSGIFNRNLIKTVKDENQFIFRQGTTIVNAITEIMIMSDYCTGILKKTPDNSGMYDWFRVETEVYLIDEATAKNLGMNTKPKLLVFKVVPYKIHESKIGMVNAVHDYRKLLNEAVKRYDYIYTGKNVDIIDFDITLNNAFYTPMVADAYGQHSGSSALANRFSADASNPGQAFRTTTVNGTPEPVAGAQTVGSKITSYKNNDGSPTDTYKTQIAKHFQERILNSDLSMVTATLKIVGDPYYIADSGLGNYTNTNSTTKLNLTSSGAMDYQSGEVDILVNFFTPVDISKAGNMIFAKDLKNGEQLNVPFSGLYQVWSVKHSFSQGKFTQELSLLRRPNQQRVPPQRPATITPVSAVNPELDEQLAQSTQRIADTAAAELAVPTSASAEEQRVLRAALSNLPIGSLGPLTVGDGFVDAVFPNAPNR